ncbi:hypothetical protein FM106_23235 [Brachybacterium faecium]|nr:hypothetical protein FM106_23235 [Brachybacterium faecium]
MGSRAGAMRSREMPPRPETARGPGRAMHHHAQSWRTYAGSVCPTTTFVGLTCSGYPVVTS